MSCIICFMACNKMRHFRKPMNHKKKIESLPFFDLDLKQSPQRYLPKIQQAQVSDPLGLIFQELFKLM